MCRITVTTVIVITATIAFITPSAHAQCASTQLAAPIAGDAFAGDQFGRSVAVHESLAVVGAPEDDFGEGSAYVYEFDGAAWQQVAKLTASDATAGDKFGSSVGVSGDVVVVGAYQPFPAEQPGKAYVYEQPAGGWVDMTETATLTTSDGANNDNFGFAVDIDGTTIVIGAYLDDDGGTNSGSAFVFEQPFGGWATMTETGKLTSGDLDQEDQFGISVAIAGDTIAVGADRDSNVAFQAGAAYVFVKPAGGWESAVDNGKLTAAVPVEFDRCGLSVGVGEGFVVAGAWGDDQVAQKTGAALVFVRPVTGWSDMTTTAKLVASDAVSGDHLGWSVEADGQVIAAGAPANLFDGSGFGATYLFLQPISGWADAIEDAKLVSSSLTEDDEFGTAVALSGPLVNVGARFFPTGGYMNAGAAYLFGGALDCNDNQEIDICEIVSGSSPDDNGDGMLDECEDLSSVPDTNRRLILHQNWPNPFNPSTEIRYTVSSAGDGALQVFDLHGKLVKTLQQGRFAAGNGSVVWNGRDDDGQQVGSGVYVYRLSIDGQTRGRRMVMLK